MVFDRHVTSHHITHTTCKMGWRPPSSHGNLSLRPTYYNITVVSTYIQWNPDVVGQQEENIAKTIIYRDSTIHYHVCPLAVRVKPSAKKCSW